MNLQDQYLECIHQRYPDLLVKSVQFDNAGQFNDVLIVNDEIVFRFPRSEQVIQGMLVEKTILSRIQAGVPLRVPRPIYSSLGTSAVGQVFVGYEIIPGVSLTLERLHNIPYSHHRARLAQQVGQFLYALHHFPPQYIGIDLPRYDTRADWESMYAEIRQLLFPHMRPQAREQVSQQFEQALNQPNLLVFEPRLRHGDFGPSNIIFDESTGKISGIIDFSETGLGDPAVDLAGASLYGDEFVAEMTSVYPELDDMRERAAFYRSTFALQEALAGVKDGDSAAFQAGLQAYR